ncbi:PQQ-like beta-propeller repeat protein [Micromonospora sp. WMMC241]|uniref:PQQ-binding-like beta-propeller repeat protein n=1 Tax=Micromonospora sp. WMMC241 TaxID=3015159 RepID=UPI0022B61C3C|nr:PQQ-binding-like beta-propeller repeat protein [Micromonospora sp. WMMC241]MCZ7440597.1 PQQ-like beta-propeller repeat protein [Micromonospora sp. WMMC241]
MTYQHQQQPPAYPPPGWPGPAGVPPAAPRRRGRLALLLAGGLVAVLAVAAGTAYGVSRLVGGPAEGGRTLRAAWVLDFPERQRNGLKTFDGQDMFGAWLVGDAVVRAQPDGVIAYRLGDGGQAWGVPAPPGSSLCGAAQTLAGGRGVVALGSADSCDTLVGFDAATGARAWQAAFPAERREGRDTLAAPDLSVAGGQVVVRADQRVLGYSLADGRRLWRSDADRLLPGRDCRLADTRAAGDLAVVTARCDGDRGALLGLDPATGKVRWQQRLPTASAGVLSVDPLVSLPGLNDATFAARDAAGRPRATFGNPVDGTRFSDLPVNRSNSVEGPAVRPYLADADTLYLPTEAANVAGKARQANQVVAIDLATGKRRWVSAGHTDSEVELIRLDEAGLLAWEVGDRRDLAPRLVRVDRASGTVSVLAEGPRSAGTEGSDATVLERDGTVVLVPWKHVGADAAITVLR